MKKLISAILILLLCLGIYSCIKNDAASTATTATTDNSTASSPEVIIFHIQQMPNMLLMHIRLPMVVQARNLATDELLSSARQHMI